MSPAGALNFKMLADLKGGVAGGLTQVATLGSGKGGIPFAIEGTTSNPHFIPDMKGVAGGIAQGAFGDAKAATKGNPGECNQRPAREEAEVKIYIKVASLDIHYVNASTGTSAKRAFSRGQLLLCSMNLISLNLCLVISSVKD